MQSDQCLRCKHYIAGKLCKAFDGEDDNGEIPQEIINGTFEHTKKHPDQKNNILFSDNSKTKMEVLK